MPTKFSVLFPTRLVLLDLFGAVLVAIGVIELLTQAGFVPELLRFRHHDLVLIGVGFLLMVPLAVNIVFARRQNTDSN